MKYILYSILILVTSYDGFAGYRVYSGGNFSKFNTNSYFRFDGIFGLDKTWDGEQSSWSLGVKYIVRSTYTNDNVMLFNMTDQGYHFDALFSVGYLEVPFMNIVHFSMDKFKFGLILGPSLAIAVLDNSKWYNSKHFNFKNDRDYRQKLDNYYKEAEDPGILPLLTDAGFFLNAGFFVTYQNYYLELRYSHGLNELGFLNGLIMNGEKYRTLEIVFGVHVIAGE